MKRSKIFMLILRLILGVVPVLLIWKPLVMFTFAVSQGQEPSFDMGDNYVMSSPMHSIDYWPRGRNVVCTSGVKSIIFEDVVEFALSGPWLIGRTEKGWFAINKKTHELNYPYPSKTDLEPITGFDVESLNFTMDIFPYMIVCQRAKKVVACVKRFLWVLLFVLPTALGFGPYIWRRLRARSERKGRPITG